MKQKIKVLFLLLLLIVPSVVFAEGTAKCDLTASDSSTVNSTRANLNSNVTLYVRVSNINAGDGILSVAGILNYSSEYLEFVKVENLTASWTNNYNQLSNEKLKFNIMDFSMSIPVNNDKAVYAITFKTLKEGSTRVTMTDTEVASTEILSLASNSNNYVGIDIGTSAPAKSNDNNLKELSVSNGTLSPAFDPNVTSYTVEVDENVESIDINGSANHSKAEVTGMGTKTLNSGSNQFEIKVKAENGEVKSYTVVVNKKSGESGTGEDTPDPTPVDNRSSDNTLKSLSVSKGNLYPEFDPATTTYSITVDNDVTNIDVSALANDDKASVVISGNTNLREGMNTIQVKVTAENESVKTYTINVNRKKANNSKPEPEKSDNNLLKSLLVGDGTLKPDFDPNTADYSLTIGNDINTLDLQAIAQDNKAKVEIANNENLIVGKNVITITVTAENGAQRVYTINVTKVDKEPNNKLDDITISEGELNPKFDPNHTFYDVEVPSGTKEIDVTPKLANPNSKVHYIVNGVSQENGKVKLNEGNNLVQLQIEDENGFVKSYYLTINRKLSYYSIFGLKVPKWLVYTLLILFILLFAYLLFLLLKKRKKKEETPVVQSAPTIEFKPEFNFGSKNQDNDQVQDGGVLNQNSSEAKSQTEDHDEEKYNRPEEEVPYDPYDDIVTKDELMDAIIDRDPEKLKILYEQEMLNRKKEELKAKEEEKGE